MTTLLSRKVRIPYPILLVLGGLFLALIPGLPRVRLNPELVFLDRTMFRSDRSARVSHDSDFRIISQVDIVHRGGAA